MHIDELSLILAFIVVGLFTFSFRAFFLYYQPKFFTDNVYFKRALESVPSSLLVALVVPFTLFIGNTFSPFRVEVLAIMLTIPVVLVIKKPGLSLIVAILLSYSLTFVLQFMT